MRRPELALSGPRREREMIVVLARKPRLTAKFRSNKLFQR